MTGILETLLDKARKAGADTADAVMIAETALQVSRRLGKAESLERSESQELGLRVFAGKQQALVSTTDFSDLDMLAERAVAMARAVPEDPWCGIAEPAQLATDWPDLELCDPVEPTPEELIARADQTEEAARAVKGITNSEGASAGWGRHEVGYAASNGFSGSYVSTGHSFSVSVLAGEGTAMERDYDYASATFAEDLESPETIGTRAGERTVRRLGAKKGPTKKLPVVFDPRLSRGLVGTLARAASGRAVARGTSMLKECMGDQIFAPGVTIIDDPFLKRGRRSTPFDAEGIAPERRVIVENGVLQGWFLDLAAARQLGLPPTGHAARGSGTPPAPKSSNLFMEPGQKTPAALIAEIEEGFYVTDMMGDDASIVTGDYSKGAAGFWIENGEITYPVSEMTVAGNMKDMWLNLEAANDLILRYGIDAPTLRVDGMMVA